MRITWPAFVVLGLAVATVACSSDDKPSPSDAGTGGKPSTSPDAAPPACTADEPDAAGSFPCDVSAILVAKCQRCHTSREAAQTCFDAGSCLKAPFPLLTWSDTRAIYGDTPVYTHIADAVESGFMPLKATTISPPVEGLSDTEVKTLADWANACAPSGSGSCD